MSDRSTPLFPVVTFDRFDDGRADELLVSCGHYLGECARPFGRQSWALVVHGEPVAVAVSASTVSASVPGAGKRGELVELARLVRHPAHGWSTRVALRLWREVAVPAWDYWPARAAVAYSQDDRHEGRIYRFDGWKRIGSRRGSVGGGTWTNKRAEGHQARGPKTLWLWEVR